MQRFTTLSTAKNVSINNLFTCKEVICLHAKKCLTATYICLLSGSVEIGFDNKILKVVIINFVTLLVIRCNWLKILKMAIGTPSISIRGIILHKLIDANWVNSWHIPNKFLFFLLCA